jgi:uncharacterized protein YjgD (DUF1641 family)
LLKVLFILAIYCISFSIYSQTGVVFQYPKSFDSPSEEKLVESIKLEFSKFPAQKFKTSFTLDPREVVIKKTSGFYIELYYTYRKDLPPDYYAIIFDPAKEIVIDSVSVSTRLEILQGIEIDKEEIARANSERLSEFRKKIEIALSLNSSKNIQQENLNEHLASQPIGKKIIFPLAKKDTEASAKSAFQFLEDQVVVTATRTKSSVKEAPAAVYVITQKMIRERGYRTLIDALQDVPGFDIQHIYGVIPEYIHQRGLTGENTRSLVYIDGVPDINISGNGPLAGTIRFPLANVD